MVLRQWCAVRGKEYLLEQWHPTKNKGLTPDNVTNSSGKEVWWRCENGHEWKTQVKTRANSSTGCPCCREELLRQKRLANPETMEEPAPAEIPTPTEASAPCQNPTKERYLGSARFFKTLILLAVILLIAAPTALSVRSGAQLSDLKTQLETLQAQLADMSAAAAEGEAAGDVPENVLPDADVPSYQSLYPELYAEDAARSTVNTDKTAYLTFDDGPSARTPEILAVLERYNVKATFFVIGQTNEQSLQWMRDIAAAGHTLGVHSYSHKYQRIYASVEDYLDDFNLMYTQIVGATGVAPQIFRFPGGSINGYNGGTWREIIAEMVRRGFVYFDWNVSNDDSIQSAPVSAATLAQNCLAQVDSLNRAVILMHDSASKKTTVQALPAIIEGYQNAGFTFAPLTAEVKPVIYGYPE